MSLSLETKILDFLQLMKQVYQREMDDAAVVESDRDCRQSCSALEKCEKCESSVCQMVRHNNEGLDCWLTYCDNPGEVYRYWFSGKVMNELKNSFSSVFNDGAYPSE